MTHKISDIHAWMNVQIFLNKIHRQPIDWKLSTKLYSKQEVEFSKEKIHLQSFPYRLLHKRLLRDMEQKTHSILPISFFIRIFSLSMETFKEVIKLYMQRSYTQ